MRGRIVIVGAGLAGARCAQTLRAEGFEGELTLVGEEPDPPYERPALSKAYLAGTREDLTLPGDWHPPEVRLMVGTRVEQVDPARRRVRTANGDLEWDALVLATGARPRRLRDLFGPGIHFLRTQFDAAHLRAELTPGRRLAIVGAGFVGTEVASTALELGLDVAIVDAARVPFEQTLGHDVGRLLASHYRGHGVELRLGAHIEGLRRDSDGALRALALEDGTELSCDTMVVAVGAEPAGELVGLPGGIPTDGEGRTALPGVYACGDVASAWSHAAGRHLRVGHWTSAAEQGAAVARAILGREQPPAASPYFWSDQFGVRIQHMGVPAGWAHVVLEHERESFEARYLAPDGRLVAALLVNRPRAAADLRRRLASDAIAA